MESDLSSSGDDEYDTLTPRKMEKVAVIEVIPYPEVAIDSTHIKLEKYSPITVIQSIPDPEIPIDSTYIKLEKDPQINDTFPETTGKIVGHYKNIEVDNNSQSPYEASGTDIPEFLTNIDIKPEEDCQSNDDFQEFSVEVPGNSTNIKPEKDSQNTETFLESTVEIPENSMNFKSEKGGQNNVAPSESTKELSCENPGKNEEGLDNIWCPKCLNHFPTTKAFNSHKCPKGKKEYKCSFCSHEFKQQGDLRDHINWHLDKRDHVCSQCGKAFVQLTSLRQHETIHSGIREFKCNVCQKQFRDKSNLKRHERIHTSQKDFICKVCGRGFVQSSALRSHEKIHANIKEFSCSICNRAFRQSSQVKTHMMVHTQERRMKRLLEKEKEEQTTNEKHGEKT